MQYPGLQGNPHQEVQFVRISLRVQGNHLEGQTRPKRSLENPRRLLERIRMATRMCVGCGKPLALASLATN
eukprot:5064755-Amphidinium_carterae.1